MADLKLLDESWNKSEDHAKWAVTVDKRWICIGDINREVRLALCWLEVLLLFQISCTCLKCCSTKFLFLLSSVTFSLLRVKCV